MAIDQDLCTGCQACVAACSMENNIAFVGEEDASYGRSLQWIRIERFWEGVSRSQDDLLPADVVPALP
jgi:Fe-S-cluster-containing dehydrogenase component